MMLASALSLWSLTPAQAASRSFSVEAASGGAHHTALALDSTWTSSAEIRFSGRGLTALVLTGAKTGAFVATATRWAPLKGQAAHSDNVTVFSSDPTFKTWSVPRGRYELTLVCSGPCSVTFSGAPRALGPTLHVRGSARHVHLWSAPVTTGGAPGGLVTHDLPSDVHGALLASVAASARFTVTNQQDADVCLVSDEPVCRRVEDGEEQQRTFSQVSQLVTDSTFRSLASTRRWMAGRRPCTGS